MVSWCTSRAARRLPFLFALLLASCVAQAGLLDLLFSTPKGHLLIVGGGDTPDDVQQRFVALAGGPGQARIAILPMASTRFDEEAREVTEDFSRLGATVRLVDLTQAEARSEAGAAQLEHFDGYWFTGGDQSRLSAILGGSLALDVLARRYQEGAAIGGTSAGASVMSSVMLTGRLRAPRDPEEAEIVNIAKGMIEVSKGFGFIKGAIVDQHFMKRARYNRLLSAVLDHPQLVGVGIDEETALLVRPDGLWEVLGNHYVKIFDARRANIIDDDDSLAKASDIRMHVLPAGSTFDMRKRRVLFRNG